MYIDAQRTVTVKSAQKDSNAKDNLWELLNEDIGIGR